MSINKNNIALSALLSLFVVTLWGTTLGCGQAGLTTVDAGDDITVLEGSSTEITAVSGNASNEDLSDGTLFTWEFFDENGQEISGLLSDAESQTVTFNAPFVFENTNYLLSVTGRREDLFADDTINVTVLDAGLDAPAPILVVTPSAGVLDFIHGIGSSPCPQSIGPFNVINEGAADLAWSIENSPAWAFGIPSSGIVEPGSSTTVNTSFNCNVSGPGSLSGSFDVTSEDGQSGSVPVTGSVR